MAQVDIVRNMERFLGELEKCQNWETDVLFVTCCTASLRVLLLGIDDGSFAWLAKYSMGGFVASQ